MPVHQIEYRWLPQRDFTPIAASFAPSDAPAAARSERLKRLVRPPDVRERTESMVWLPLDEETDAIIWRGWLPDAAPVSDEGGLRHAMVARVLLCPTDPDGADAALALAAGFPEELGPSPGTVHRDQRLPALPMGSLEKLVDGRRTALDDAARDVPELGVLAAAVLRAPDLPLSVLLPEPLSPPSLSESLQVSMLWGLRRTLSPPRTADTTWRWSWSTHEPPHNDHDSLYLPHLCFRTHHLPDGAPPATLRRESVVRPFEEYPEYRRQGPRDRADEAGHLLAMAYRELGDELGRILRDLPDHHLPLDHHLQAVVSGLRRAGYSPPPPGAPRPSALAARVERPAARPSSTTANGRDLLRWYTRLDETQGTEAFETAVAALRALRHAGAELPSRHRMDVLDLFIQAGWYLDDLARPDPSRTADRLAELLHPVLHPGLLERPVLSMVEVWTQVSGVPQEVLQALFVLHTAADEPQARELWPILNRIAEQPVPKPAPDARPSPRDGGPPAWRPSPEVMSVATAVIAFVLAVISLFLLFKGM